MPKKKFVMNVMSLLPILLLTSSMYILTFLATISVIYNFIHDFIFIAALSTMNICNAL